MNNCTVCGDIRFDRVIQVANEKKELPQIRQFKNGNLLVVCGSTWPIDEVYLLEIIAESPQNVKWIFAPHQIQPTEIQKLTKIPNINTVLYSTDNDMETLRQAKLLVIDCIGLLSSVYAYADIAYVGGGFGKAVHNTAEPAVYGIPVVIGPIYHKFKEAVDMSEIGAVLVARTQAELRHHFHSLLSSDELRQKCGRKAKEYIINYSGGTKIIWAKTKTLLIQ